MKYSQTSSGTDIFRDALETDVYDCSMQNAVLQLYPEALAEYQFVDRDRAVYPHGFAGLLTEKFQDLRGLNVGNYMVQFMKRKWNFLHPSYFEWLKSYRFNPDYIHLRQDSEGRLVGGFIGPLIDIIPTEQISMATTSQIRNEVFDWLPDDNWQEEFMKILEVLVENNITFAEFGLRRRAYAWMHDHITLLLANHGGKSYVGSSSPFHCLPFDHTPKGTVAHLWYLLHGAKYGVENANEIASIAWRAVYGTDLGTALPDTWGRRLFFSTIAPGMTQMVHSYRHDSGSPFEFTDDLRAYFTHPRNQRDLKGVTLMFTDSVNEKSAPEIYRYASQWFNVTFGIGGALTNNRAFFKKTPAYRPLNMVAKPVRFSFDGGATWIPIAKVPDGKGKNVGNARVIAEIERLKDKYPWIY